MRIKNKLTKILIALFVVCPIIAVSYIYISIPNKITLSSGNIYSCKIQPLAAFAKHNSISAVTNGGITNISGHDTGEYTLSLKLFDKIPVRNVSVEVMPKIYVIPSGEPIGMKMYTDGVLIVGISYVIDENGKNIYPAKEAGIREGDIIKEINGVKINSIEEMTECVNNTDGKLTVKIERGRGVYDIDVNACRSGDDGIYKLGIWVRDAAAGVGTMTFYNPETQSFAALGHAITDIDTGDILKLGNGKAMSCKILSINKGEKGEPGELIGAFTNDEIGDIFLNNGLGVYGKLYDYENENYKEIAVATRFEIQTGSAYILADVDGNGVKKYSIEILRSAKDNSQNNKGIIFRVTDEELLNKTGGIVQGMSGCPIIQNDMLIGAVTHVFINDPTKGYGIFAENMMDMINMMER